MARDQETALEHSADNACKGAGWMSHPSLTSKAEATLLLKKWHEEQTPLYMVLSAGDPPTSCRLNMPGQITEVAPSLIVTHARGHAEGFLKCSWSDITSFEYLELREDAEKLAGYPGAPDFMRNRSILAIHASPDLLIRLVDLTLPS